MENGSKSLSSVFIFKLCHFKAVDDYITLHNLSLLATRDVVIISFMKNLPSLWFALTLSSFSSWNFCSCILKPKLGLAMSRQNLTTVSDSSMLSDDTHITYSVVMVTERDIPAAL